MEWKASDFYREKETKRTTTDLDMHVKGERVSKSEWARGIDKEREWVQSEVKPNQASRAVDAV